MTFYRTIITYKFTALLIFQLVFILLYPFVEGSFCEWLLHVIATFAFLFIASVCKAKPFYRNLNIGFFIVLILTYALDYFNFFMDLHPVLSLDQFRIFYCIVFSLFYIYITIMLCVHMLTDRKPHVDTLSGTAAVYLMIALSWTFFYLSLDSFIPHSFRQGLSDQGLNYINWLFYSIGILVSSNFADVTPVNNFAQSFSILESVIGALYIAIITARIVGVDFDDPLRIGSEAGTPPEKDLP